MLFAEMSPESWVAIIGAVCSGIGLSIATPIVTAILAYRREQRKEERDFQTALAKKVDDEKIAADVKAAAAKEADSVKKVLVEAQKAQMAETKKVGEQVAEVKVINAAQTATLEAIHPLVNGPNRALVRKCSEQAQRLAVLEPTEANIQSAYMAAEALRINLLGPDG